HGPSQLRHVGVIHQPDARSARFEREWTQVREEGLHAAEETRRRSGSAASGSSWSENDQAHAGSNVVLGRACRRPVQAVALPILVKGGRRPPSPFPLSYLTVCTNTAEVPAPKLEPPA